MIKALILNKNRGWRGLAEAITESDDGIRRKVLFSFSQAVWEDMLDGLFVLQDEEENYIVIRFDNHTSALPKPYQQRSVLISGIVLPVLSAKTYDKGTWRIDASTEDFTAIIHYLKNNNHHTTSEWNNVGIRVSPMI